MNDADHARMALRVATIGTVVGATSVASAMLKVGLVVVLAGVTVTSAVVFWPKSEPAAAPARPRSELLAPPPAPEVEAPSEPARLEETVIESRPGPRRSAKPALAQNAESLAREAKILNAAHAALAKRPTLALEHAKEHEREFPEGTLSAERELIRIEALIVLGRRTHAEARAKALLRRDAHSIYATRVETLLKVRPR